MKAITTTLYVCGALMAAAAIIGAIDYKAAKRNGHLENLYREEKPSSIVKQEKTIEMEDYSRGKIEKAMPEERTKNVVGKKLMKIKNIAYKADEKQDGITVEPISTPLIKKKKGIRFRQFSRSAIREDFVIEKKEVKIDTAEVALQKN